MLSKRRYRIQMLIIILLTLSGSIIVVCHVGFPSTSLSTGSSMSETFESDIANMVYEWNPQDPRSEKERQRVLFGFMTETYNGSFFIPNSLLQGNFITQAVIGDRRTIARDKVGLVFWPENQTTQVYGVSPNVKSGEPIGFTSNCVMCHLAEIDGKIYFGAGNKLFDEKVLVDSLTKLTSSRSSLAVAGFRRLQNGCQGKCRSHGASLRQNRSAHAGTFNRFCRIARRILPAVTRRHAAESDRSR